MARTGWYNRNKLGNSVKYESHRHSLAAKGVKTALPKGVKNVSFALSPTPNFDMVAKSSKLIENNKNISISTVDGLPYINFIPYNRVITLKYLAKWIPIVIKKYPNFALYAQGYNFDGLYETNRDLIKEGFTLQDNLTNETIEVKPTNKKTDMVTKGKEVTIRHQKTWSPSGTTYQRGFNINTTILSGFYNYLDKRIREEKDHYRLMYMKVPFEKSGSARFMNLTQTQEFIKFMRKNKIPFDEKRATLKANGYLVVKF